MPADDRGFSMMEMMVALTVLALVATATIPLFISGLRAANAAKLHTQAKNLGQERLEQMRNLAYHVAAQNGDYKDLLDTYFRSTAVSETNSGCPAGGGYSSATRTYTCNVGTVTGYPAFTQRVATRFLDANSAAVAPYAGYASQTNGRDLPVTAQVSVVVTTTWKQFGVTKTHRLYSQIANAQPTTPLIVSQARVSAVRVGSAIIDPATGLPVTLTLEAGVVNADGSLSTGSSAAATAQGVYATLSSGEQVSGAKVALVAPPSPATGSVGSVGGTGLGGTCAIACFGTSSIAGTQKAEIAEGQPLVALPPGVGTGRLTASLKATGNGYGFEFRNGADNTDIYLNTARPMVFMHGGGDFARGSAFLSAANNGTTHSVSAGAMATSEVVDIMPTSLTAAAFGAARPYGMVQVSLTKAEVTCSSDGSVATFGAAPFDAKVRWFVASANAYTAWLDISATSGVDLDDPAYEPSGILLGGTDANGLPLTLGHYIQSWDSLTSAEEVSQPTEAGGVSARASLDGVVRITTQPTRKNIAESTITLSVGNTSCRAEDNR